MSVGKYKTRPPISHGANTSVDGDHIWSLLLGRREANLCFHFAGSEENVPDIAKSRDASLDKKEFSSFLQILMKQSSFLF